MQEQKQVVEDDFTTIKVYKRDAQMLNQILGLLKMRNVNLNQSDFLHELLSFAFEREKQFFSEMQRWTAIKSEMQRTSAEMNQWMQIMFKRMQNFE